MKYFRNTKKYSKEILWHCWLRGSARDLEIQLASLSPPPATGSREGAVKYSGYPRITISDTLEIFRISPNSSSLSISFICLDSSPAQEGERIHTIWTHEIFSWNSRSIQSGSSLFLLPWALPIRQPRSYSPGFHQQHFLQGSHFDLTFCCTLSGNRKNYRPFCRASDQGPLV